MALETVKYFQERGKEISLVVIETVERRKMSERERKFRKAHMLFNIYLSPFSILKNLISLLWVELPTTLQARIKSTLNNIREDSVTMLCEERDIPYVEVTRHSSMETRLYLDEHNIGYVLLTSSAWLIKEPLLSMRTTKIINAHCAKLPEHRSLDSLPWSVLENDPLGLTAHIVDSGIDTGPILLFIEILPQKEDNLITLRERVDGKKPEIFLKAVQGLNKGQIKPIEQRESEGTCHRPMTVSELINAEKALQKRIMQQ